MVPPAHLDDATGTRVPADIRVRLLGPVEVVGPSGRALLTGARQRAVVGLLAVRVGTVVPAWRLVQALWGEDPPRTAVRSLHSHVARVRRALADCGLPAALVTRDGGYALVLDRQAVDAWWFEEYVRRARAEDDDARAVTQLQRGLELWRHEVALADAEPTAWGAAEVARLAEARLAALEDRWDAEFRLGRHAATSGEIERLLVSHPLRERLVGLLMLALYRAGRQTAALEAYQRLRVRLADELGVDPDPDLRDLHTRMLRRDPSLNPAARSVVDTAQATPRPVELPARVGHFTGRVAELAGLDRLVQEPAEDVRIAVISGPAGMGKTALALQWAHRVADHFPDGRLFVDLRGPDGPAAPLALSRLLRSLGVPADRVPTDPTERASLYRSLLHDRRVLVVVDDGSRTEDILPLVPAGAGNVLVVTSRTALSGLATHHEVYPIGVDVFTEAEAVGLLTRMLGADAVDGDRAVAVELVRLCGGMPLALRIAAAKLAGYPRQSIRDLVAELAGPDRLDALTVVDGSRSVQAVFLSAYDALSTTTARVFRLLGLHPGLTFTPDIAAALADLPLAAARQAMDELVTANLVTRTAGRYRFHDLVRLFAARCAGADEAAAGRLVDWYLAVVDAANRAVHPGRDRVTPAPRYRPAELPFASEHHAALAFLDDERDNLLPIVRYAAEHGQPTAAWQLTYLLTGFFDSRGHRDERVEMCRWGVTAAQADGDRPAEALMRSGLGVVYIAARRFDEALGSLHEALPLMRACGDRRGEGHVHNNIAVAYSNLRRFDEAVDALRQARAVHTGSGYRLGIALAHNNAGHTYVRMGRPELSYPDLEAALDIVRDLGNPRLEAAVLQSLGDADLACGDLTAALDHLGQALAICRRIGDRRDEAATLNGVGTVHLRRGDSAAALPHLRQASALAAEIGDGHLEAVALTRLGQAQVDTGDPASARDGLRRAVALRLRIPDPHEEAHLHRTLAELEQVSGNPDAAEHHRGLAISLYRRVNATDEADRLAAAPR